MSGNKLWDVTSRQQFGEQDCSEVSHTHKNKWPVSNSSERKKLPQRPSVWAGTQFSSGKMRRSSSTNISHYTKKWPPMYDLTKDLKNPITASELRVVKQTRFRKQLQMLNHKTSILQNITGKALMLQHAWDSKARLRTCDNRHPPISLPHRIIYILTHRTQKERVNLLSIHYWESTWAVLRLSAERPRRTESPGRNPSAIRMTPTASSRREMPTPRQQQNNERAQSHCNSHTGH